MSHHDDNLYTILGKLAALKPTAQEKHDATVKQIYESVEAQGSIISGVDAVQAKLAKSFAESDFSKMSTAIQKTGKSKASADAITAAAGREKLGQKEMTRRSVAGRKDECAGCAMGECSLHSMQEGNDRDAIVSAAQKAAAIKSMKLHGLSDEQIKRKLKRMGMQEGETTHTGGEKVATAKGTIHKSKATVDTEKELSRGDVPDLDKDDNAPAASTEKKGRGRPKMATKDRSQASMPWGGNPPKVDANPTKKWPKDKTRVHKMVGETLEDKMNNLTQDLITEGRLIDESGETLDHILNRFKHDVKRFEAGEDIYNTDLYHALFDYYSENGEMPYGTQKARDGDPVEFIHDRLDMLLADKAYGKDPANAEDYGVESEAIGDPQPGIPGNLPVPGKMDRLNNPRDYYEEKEEGTTDMADELNELARLAGLSEESRGQWLKTKAAGKPTVDAFGQQDIPVAGNASKSEVDEEDDMEEGNPFGKAVRDAKVDGVQPGEKVEVDGKTYPVKEGMEVPGSDASEFNVSTNMSSDGEKNVTVTATGEHAASLLQMLRIAGLGNGEAAQALQQPQAEPEMGDDEGAEFVVVGQPEAEVDEEAVDVDQPAEKPANSPDPKYGTIKNITTQGDDMNREKRQDPGTANKAANPMTNAQQVLKSVAQLESKLAEEYESIKKVSK